MTESELVVLTTARDRVEASLIEGLLSDAGIESMTSTDDADGWRPNLTFSQGVQILCRATDLQRARDLLNALESN